MPRQIGVAGRLVASGCLLGEGPLARSNGDLLWVDIAASRIHRWRDGRHDVFEMPFVPSALAEATDGSLVVATPDGIVNLADVGSDEPTRVLSPLPGVVAGIRMNDGKADPAGRFVGGTVAAEEPRLPVCSLWSFGGPGPASELVAAVSISNGLAWSADGDTMYFIDTPTRRIDAFDYDAATGEVANRRPEVVIDERAGDPDGMCIDAEGGLWVALWGGSAVHRYVDGVLDAVVEIPTPYPTCPTFAGPDRSRLVVTTASEPLGDDAPLGAGDVYVIEAGVTGPPPHLVDLARFS